jgi:hypothetical protein
MRLEQLTIAARGEPGSLARDLRALARLRSEFPAAPFQVGDVAPPDPALHLAARAWRDPAFDPQALDERIARLAPASAVRLVLDAEGAPLSLAIAVAGEVLTRCQRWVDRRNEQSQDACFEAVLARHRALVPSERDHALDVWQWALRLDPRASFALQVAALFRGAGRFAAARERREDAGAAIAREVLAAIGAGPPARERVAALLAGRERGGGGADLVTLAEAEALSFFSLASSAFLAAFGTDATRRRVREGLARLRPESRARLGRVRVRREIAALIAEEAGRG